MFEQTFKNIDDILHKDVGCSSELDYTEQTSWMLFLKYLDDLEHEKSPPLMRGVMWLEVGNKTFSNRGQISEISKGQSILGAIHFIWV